MPSVVHVQGLALPKNCSRKVLGSVVIQLYVSEECTPSVDLA